MSTSAALDGLSRVFAPGPSDLSLGWSLVGACILHVGVAAALPRHAPEPRAALRPATQIVDLDPVPPPSSPPEAQRPVATPAPAPAPPRGPTPPAPAAAALTRKEEPSAPADLTDGILVGSAETYVGGSTSARGSSLRASPAASSAPAGTGAGAPAAPATGPDRSQRARLAGAGAWGCPFPAEADVAGLDHAVVTLRISVDPDGAATAVAITTDPGHGFGREARACALSKRFAPALDRDGRPIAGISLVNVRFDR